MNAIAPIYVLTPERDGSVKVSEAPADRHCIKWIKPEPFDPSFRADYTPLHVITINVQRLAHGFGPLTRRQRRWKARHGTRGRRAASPVPVAIRREIRIAAHPDVSASYVQRFADEHATTETVWRRRPALR